MPLPEPTKRVEGTAAGLRLVVPRGLKSPNAWLWKHWRIKQRETREWEKAVWAIAGSAELRPWCKSRVTVTRIVPSKRNFIKDDDNLRFCVKPMLDALKRLGLIHDDSREWLEHSTPTQEVGPDWSTVIVIERLIPPTPPSAFPPNREIREGDQPRRTT